jgi:Flp pilus assembly protein TadD/mono/diheme cytochrome c family protein
VSVANLERNAMRRGIFVAGLLASALAAGGCNGAPSAATAVTFNRDVAPIVFANCAPCHRPGGAAPFPLLTYADAFEQGEAMARQTRERHMPPWLPDPGEVAFVGERRLRDEQIETIQRWVSAGKPEGTPADLPKPPAFTDGWQLGRPDEIVNVSTPLTLPPGGEDVYRNLVLRTSLKSNAFVRAVEFKTGGAPIHHAVIRVDPTSASRRRDGEDGKPGFAGMAWGSVRDPDGHFVGWAPGRGPIVAPDGMPWRLDRGTDLVVEVHVLPSATAQVIQPTIGLFLTSTPPSQTPLTVRMGTKLIDIPAGKPDYVVTDTYRLPVDVDLMSVYPHAHYLGKEMTFTATLPNGRSRTLIHIPQWSFHSQQDYRYVTPIALPAGTTLTMRYTFDNSTANHHNPSHPPVRVQAGPRSTDEMAELGLQVLPKSPADAARIAQEFEERELSANLAMAEARVRESPQNAEYRALAGGSYVEMGRHAEAIPHLEAAIRLKLKSSATHNYLGIALMGLGRTEAALPHFRRAADLAPTDENVPFNLGNALRSLSRLPEAVAAYERALALNPDFPDAHVNLGALLIARGQFAAAMPHYERAVELRPDSAIVHNNFASALASVGRYKDALQHVRHALAIKPDYAPALDNLRRLERMGIK